VLEQGEDVVCQGRWVCIASKGKERMSRERTREVSEKEETDIGSRVLVSHGLRWSDVEGSKIMTTCLAQRIRLKL
jgi:hypothetical protein